MLIKLTEVTFDSVFTADVHRNPIWVVADHIVFMRRPQVREGMPVTSICMGAPHFAWVEETPEEIARLVCES